MHWNDLAQFLTSSSHHSRNPMITKWRSILKTMFRKLFKTTLRARARVVNKESWLCEASPSHSPVLFCHPYPFGGNLSFFCLLPLCISIFSLSLFLHLCIFSSIFLFFSPSCFPHSLSLSLISRVLFFFNIGLCFNLEICEEDFSESAEGLCSACDEMQGPFTVHNLSLPSFIP